MSESTLAWEDRDLIARDALWEHREEDMSWEDRDDEDYGHDLDS